MPSVARRADASLEGLSAHGPVMTTTKHVAIVADLVPRKLGSLECLLFRSAAMLREAGAETSFTFSGPIPPEVREHFDLADDLPAVALPSASRPEAVEAWVRHLAALDADVYWLHFIPVIGSLIPRLRKAVPHARICLSERISRGPVKRSRLKTLFCKVRAGRYNPCVDQYIAVSQFIADRLRNSDYVPSSRIEVIHNSVNLQRFRPQGPPGETFLSIAYLRQEKGIQVLLDAASLLRERGFAPQILIAGQGPCLEEYRRITLERQLQNVEFLGERSDIPELLSNARALIVPSLWPEAFGFVAAEAQAAGRPVIASRVGGLPEVIVDGETGMLVSPNDATDLADAMQHLMADPAEAARMGRAGRQRAEEHFDLDRAVRRHLEVILRD